MAGSRLGTARAHLPLLAALSVDALGTGVFLPLSVLYFTATTSLSLPRVGLGLTVAAAIALPVAPLLGTLVDRSGPWRVLLAANVLQAVGVGGYLLVDSFWSLVAATTAASIGNQCFWSAYAPFILRISPPGRRERWFGVVGALRNAGFGLGGLLSGVALTMGGDAGYHLVAAADAASFVLAGLLLLLVSDHARRPAREDGEQHAGPTTGRQAWREVLSDRPYLALAVVNVAFALGAFVLTVVLPVFAVERLGLPSWVPGVGLTLNCLLIALGQASVVRLATGRRRVRALQASSAFMALFAVVMLGSAAAPPGAAVALVLAGVGVLTLAEMLEGPVLAALSSEAAPPHLVGRYQSVYQLSWNVASTIAPALLTGLLAAGQWQVWVAVAALAAAAATGVTALSSRMPAARQRIGSAPEPVVP